MSTTQANNVPELNSNQSAALKALKDSETVKFIGKIPLVSGAVDYSYSVIKSNNLFYRSFLLGEEVFATSLLFVQPFASRLSTPLHKADHLVLQTLDFTKSKFPYPFEVKWDDLYSMAKSPFVRADDIVSSYKKSAKDNAQHLYEQTNKTITQLQQNENVHLQKAGNAIVSINEKLTSIAQDWSKKGKAEVAEGEQKAQGLVNSLFTELDNLNKYAKSLPAEGQKRLSPVIDTFQSTYQEAYKEAFDSKAPVQERVSKVTQYLRSQTLPALHKALLDSAGDAEEQAGKAGKELASKIENVSEKLESRK
ncbi:hypothetical protein MPSI1_000314 [Malassezia psittaci]|uniref:Uncharacterized protein n=1 Tax=Malassezia psittaci TaxID=1821823 RepID=A0AAF0JC87_9BASI|nr:hypothetical protein MPSI1_000314 [Malassezia psittaci]